MKRILSSSSFESASSGGAERAGSETGGETGGQDGSEEETSPLSLLGGERETITLSQSMMSGYICLPESGGDGECASQIERKKRSRLESQTKSPSKLPSESPSPACDGQYGSGEERGERETITRSQSIVIVIRISQQRRRRPRRRRRFTKIELLRK